MIFAPLKSKSLLVQRGAALIIVLMSLSLLFALGVPFLFASRVRSESSNEAIYRVQSRVAVQSASNYVALEQASTHPAIDTTPLFDSAAEWDGSTFGPLPQSLGDSFERQRESWGVEIENMQSKVSLATAPTMLLQNIVHPCFLTADVSHAASELPVSSTAGFPESGILSISGNWVVYGAIDSNSFLQVEADLDPPEDLEAIRFREGRFVADPRVQAITLSNLDSSGYSPPEFYADALEFDFGNPDSLLPQRDRDYLQQLTCLSSGVYGSSWWQPSSFMNREIDIEQPDVISIDNDLAVSPGTFVKLENEYGDVFESLVLASGGGRMQLASPVPENFSMFNTSVSPMSREPVDINACRPEILQALLTGLQFRRMGIASSFAYSGRGSRDWVSPNEALSVTQAVLLARPLQGPDDLWTRVLAPLAYEGAISDVDSWVIFLNGIDPNHAWLRQSTTGFGYRAGLKFQQRVNAAVRSRLGRTLARSSAEQVLQVAPAGQLLEMVHNQLRFEDYASWQRGMHGVSTLPNSIGDYASSFNDPSISLAKRFGTLHDLAIQRPDSEPLVSAIIPTPARDTDNAPYGGTGRVEHFDIRESPLGHEFDSRGALYTTTGDWGVGDGVVTNVEPLHLQGWFYVESISDATLFDYTSDYTDRNRIVAVFEQGELVVRCYGTHGADFFDSDGLDECIAVRIDPIELSVAGRWFHLSVLMRNESARGFQVCIDGVPRGEIDGFTFLTQAVAAHSPGSTSEDIYVESTVGFPSRGAVRIGNEVIEYSSLTDTSFVTQRDTSMYIGGRAIREATDVLALTMDGSHPAGAAVEIYGYSSILLGDVPPGGSSLSGDVGPWSIANCVTGVEDITSMRALGTVPFPIGIGISSTYLGAIELSECEQAPSDLFFSEAFQTDGGYAVIWQGRAVGLNWGIDGSGLINVDDDSRIGGVEIVKYSSRTDNVIILSERNVRTPGLAEAPEAIIPEGGTTFIMEFEGSITIGDSGDPINDSIPHNVYIMPISVRAAGASEFTYHQPESLEQSSFVQLAASGDPASTEWVRYDNILDGNFLRDNWEDIFRVISEVFSEDSLESGRPGGPPSAPDAPDAPSSSSSTESLELGQDPYAETPLYTFRAEIGEAEEKEQFIEFMEDLFSFRGVNGTFDHTHTAGEPAIPVFKTLRGFGPANLYSDPGYGFAGRLDRVAIMQAGETTDPLWFEVQWATPHRLENGGADPIATYVAFSEHPGLPFLGPDLTALSQSMDGLDLRNFNRIVKFPNFERPQSLASLNIGADSTGAGASLSGFVDEFGVHNTGGFGSPTDFFACGSFYLDEDLLETTESYVQVNEYDFSLNNYRVSMPNAGAGDYLAQLPPSGIIDIDGERIAYSSIDTATGQIQIAPNGRGLHGTEQRGHASGARVRIVDGRLATALTSELDASTPSFQLEDSSVLPKYGLLLIDDELIFAPMRGRSSELMMPQLSESSGRLAGDGVLRGRFGTDSAAHSSGSVAYNFPTRWLDLYAPQSDSGLLSRYQFSMTQPNAFWRSAGFEATGTGEYSRVMMLVRSGDADWSEDPHSTHHLSLFDTGQTATGELQALNFFSNHIDFRFMFDWQPGAFSSVDFLSTGWTHAPRIKRIMVDYLAESVVTQDSEVIE
jgi:hypothetical protein